MKDKLTRTGSIAVMALLGVLATVGVGYATIPSNNVISGCYSKSGGTLRVIDATTGSCSSNRGAPRSSTPGRADASTPG